MAVQRETRIIEGKKTTCYVELDTGNIVGPPGVVDILKKINKNKKKDGPIDIDLVPAEDTTRYKHPKPENIEIVDKEDVKTNEKPLLFICPFCDDGTAHSSEQGLYYHIGKEHLDEVYKWKELKAIEDNKLNNIGNNEIDIGNDIMAKGKEGKEGNEGKETGPKELTIETDKDNELTLLKKELEELKKKQQEDDATRAEKERLRKEIEETKQKIKGEQQGQLQDGQGLGQGQVQDGQVLVQGHVRNAPKKPKKTTGSSILDSMWGLDKEVE